MTDPRSLNRELLFHFFVRQMAFARAAHGVCLLHFVAGLVAVVLVAGCTKGPPAPKRAKVEGKVTVNGQPVANGFIRFMSLEPNGTNAAATIKDGHYSLTEKDGPTKGKYRVEFNVPSATKKRVPNDDVPGQFMEVPVETLPEKYHGDKSTLMRDIDPEKTQALDFSLTVP